MKILKNVQKVPGGLMVVPLLLASILNTILPGIFNIGGITTATFAKGTATMIGAACLCVGSQIDITGAFETIKRGGLLSIGKILAGMIPAILLMRFFGIEGVFGITPLLLLAGVTSINAGLFLGLMTDYGDKYDVGSQSLMGVTVGPFVTLLGIGAAGIGDFNFTALAAAIIPTIVGFVLGNIDQDIRDFLKPGAVLTMPLIGFNLGASINLGALVTGGALGVVLAIIIILLTLIVLLPIDKGLLRRPGYAAAALTTCAGSNAAVPELVAQVSPNLAHQVATATTALASATIITTITAPILMMFVIKKLGWKNQSDMDTLRSFGDV
ncbi:MAG: 2-keto-3-deoxygluconate permease [Tissierellia bacterium]|nr:2-keto-3-deoxygluconate permease [Tissierellia bacterium]